MTRLPFLLRDMKREIAAIAPNGPSFVIVMPAGTFGPVIAELASHYGNPCPNDVSEFNVDGIILRRGE